VYGVISGWRSFMDNAFQEASDAASLLELLLSVDLVEGLDKSMLKELGYAAKVLATSGKLSDEGGCIRFWTPIHAMYYSDKMYSARCSSFGGGLDSLVNFLKICVQRMSADQLRTCLSRHAGGQGLLERAFQMEFYRASFDALPRECSINADVNMGGGWVDFWIEGKAWAVELLCDGGDLSEHEKRFEPGGKYSLEGLKAYAVVDLRGPGAPRPKKRPEQCRTFFVTFNEGYATATCIAADTEAVLFTVELAQHEAMMKKVKLAR